MSNRTPRFFVALLVLSTIALGFVYARTLATPSFVDVGSPADVPYVGDFYGPEGSPGSSYRWTGQRSFLFFPNRGNQPITVSIAADAPRPEGQAQPQVSLWANGHLLAQFVAEAGIKDYSFRYAPPLLLPADLSLQIDTQPFSPPGDPRDLGLLVNTVELKSDSLSPPLHFLLILVCLMPALVLVMTGYLIFRQVQWPALPGVVVALLLLTLVSWGVLRGEVTMRLVITLGLVEVGGWALLRLVRLLDLQGRVGSLLVDGFCSLGKGLGRVVVALRWSSLRSVGSSGWKWLKTHRADLMLMALLFGGALLVRLAYYLEMPHITDEFREVQIATEVAQGTHYPLFFSVNDYMGLVHTYLLGFFLRLAGISIYTPRLYMVGMGALAVALTYCFARQMSSRPVALMSGALMLASPMHILIGSHKAVESCTTPVFSLLMLIAFYRGVRHERGFWLALSGFLAGLALQTHPFVALLFPGMAIWYVLEQRGRGRPLRDWLRCPALYGAVILFLVGYGNMIVHNGLGFLLHGRVYMLSSAQKRSAMQGPPLSLWVYFQTLRKLLQNLVSSMSGTFDFRLAPESFLQPAMIVYGGWLVAGLTNSARREKTLLLLLMGPVLILPVVNQNYSIPDDSRYLAYLLPICYVALAWFAVDLGQWLSRRGLPGLRFAEGRRSPLMIVSAVLVCLALALYPLFPLWNFYSHSLDSKWSSRAVLRVAAALRAGRGQPVPIYVDVELSNLDQPIPGCNIMKAIEYVLFLDGTECEVVSFPPNFRAPTTFNHEVQNLLPRRLAPSALLVLSQATWLKLTREYHVELEKAADLNGGEDRYGVYRVIRSKS